MKDGVRVLKSNNMSYRYEDGTMALKNINIDMSKGSIIGLIGSNGAGKTTLFKCLLGIFKPSSGEIIFEEKSLKYDKKSLMNLRKNVTMVMQDPDKQIFYSNIYDDVAFGPRNLGRDKEHVDRLVTDNLKKVRMWKLKDKPVQYISYGQKKRVSIAGAMAMEPQMILMDEPTSGLDPKMERDMVGIIKDLKEEGKTVILSSHDMDLIYEICDYIYLIKDGEIISEGTKGEVFTREELIVSSGLKLPWLVKLHLKLGFKLYEDEISLYDDAK